MERWVDVDESGRILAASSDAEEWLARTGQGMRPLELLAKVRPDVAAAIASRAGTFLLGVGDAEGRGLLRCSVMDRGSCVRIGLGTDPVPWREGVLLDAVRQHAAYDGVGHLVADVDWFVVWVDQVAGELLGRPPASLLGLNLGRVRATDWTEDQVASDRETAYGGHRLTGTSTVALPDGTVRVVERLAIPMRDGEGLITGFTVSVRDVTAAREIARLRSLDEAMSTVARVIADAAHGVNNLAARILAACDRAAMSPDPASAGPALLTVQDLTRQLGLIGREMLWVATPGAVAGPADLGGVAYGLGQFIRRVAGPEGPEVHVRATEGQYVACAPDVIVRSLSHFALRAIDIARDNGTSLTIETWQAEGRGFLWLRYEGGPNEPKLLRELLDPAMARNHALVHGYTDGVRLAFVEGGDGSVAIELSAPDAVLRPATTPTTSGSRAAARGRLLIAEDEPDLRSLYTDVLSTLFTDVVACADGQEAWDALSAADGAFALVILDLRMPRLDGMDLLARIRPRWPDLRVVVASGAAPDGVIQTAMAAGARAVLSKPFSIRELRAVVRAVLSDAVW